MAAGRPGARRKALLKIGATTSYKTIQWEKKQQPQFSPRGGDSYKKRKEKKNRCKNRIASGIVFIIIDAMIEFDWVRENGV